jgi:diguanylate cyclase (GGDEF)-like protein
MELKCLAITLAIIFCFNTPISFIKSDQLKEYQHQLRLNNSILAERVALINSLIEYKSTKSISSQSLMPLEKTLQKSFKYLKQIEYRHLNVVNRHCGTQYPSTLTTDTLFVPDTHALKIYQPICLDSKIVQQLFINIDLVELSSFTTPNLLLLNSDGTVYHSTDATISSGQKFSTMYPTAWNEISVAEKPDLTFSVDDMTVILHKMPFVAHQSVYLIQIIKESELIPPYFYIIIILIGMTIGTSYYLHQLRKEKLALSKITYTDQLSGLHNRHYLSHIKHQISLDGKFYLCILDIDHFKQVNDKYGHDIGDQVIKRVAAIIKSKIHFSDYAFRFGGEEFLVILKAPNQCAAVTMVEQIRTEIEQLAQKPSVSISGGLCCINQPIEKALKCADAQLYKAKESGRNLIIC